MESSTINTIHVLLQAIAITGWCVLLRHAVERKKYIGRGIYFVLVFAITSTLISLISELIVNNFILDWNFWYWYPTNYALQISIFYMIELVEKTIDKHEL